MATKLAGRRLHNNEYSSAWPEIEKWLREWNVDYAIQQVNLDRVDVARSMKNQARIGDVIDKDVVERYRIAMLDGDEFPPLVFWRNQTGQYVVIDGNHRLHAAIEAHFDAVAGFVVQDVSGLVVTGMTFQANVRHGKNVSDAERLHHAMWLADNGMPLAEAAKRLSLSPGLLRKAKAEIDATRRADAAGIRRAEWESLPTTIRNRLYNVSTDEGFIAATKLCVEAGLGAEAAFKMVSEMNDTKSSAKQLTIVELHREEYADRIGARKAGDMSGTKGLRVRSPKTAWKATLGMIGVLPPMASVIEHTSDSEREELAGKLNDMLNTLQKALAELEGAR